KIELGTFGLSGYGAAVDLGISYQPFQKLNISASVLDLGGIIWLKKYTNIASANNKQHYNPQDETDRNAFFDRINNGNVFDLDFPQMKLDDTAKRNRKTGLAPCVVLSAEYELLEKWLILGSLYTAHFTHPKTFNELTFTANMRPSSTFNLAVSYSVIQTEGKSFGIGAKLGPVFIGSDYIFLGKNTTNINLYLGISIPLNN
ncbi:MAG: DUF5723 family protein, partial [Parabacteroides sp.]|nr:DUF5723 family protein [Parabacteroides sp.]